MLSWDNPEYLIRLTLKGVGQADSRSYTLNVENMHGTDLAPVKLAVRGKLLYMGQPTLPVSTYFTWINIFYLCSMCCILLSRILSNLKFWKKNLLFYGGEKLGLDFCWIVCYEFTNYSKLAEYLTSIEYLELELIK